MTRPVLVQRFTVPVSGTSTSFDYYVPKGTNRFLLAKFTTRNVGTISAVAFNGVSMTAVTGSSYGLGSGSNRRAVAAWRLVAPDEGLHALTFSNSNGDQGTLEIESYVDVDQTTPIPDQGGTEALGGTGSSATSASRTLTTTADDYCVDLIAASVTALTPGGSQEVLFNPGISGYKGSGLAGASGTTTMSWSFASANYAYCAFAIRGSAATQPSPEDYTGSRGKKVWHVASQLSKETLSAGSTTYVALVPSVETGTSSATNRTRVRQASTWDNFGLRVTSNAASGSGLWTLQEDGVDTGITISIGAGATGDFSATGGSIHVDGTTSLGWKCVAGTGGATLISALWCSSEADAAEAVTQLGVHQSSALKISPGVTTYLNVSGSRTVNTTERKGQLRVPFAATWEGLEVIKVGTVTTGTVAVKSRVNGADGNQVLNWAASGSASQEDTTHSDTLAAGDLIDWQIAVGAGTGDWETERWCSRLRNTTGEFLMVAAAGAGGGYNIGTGTMYIPVAGEIRAVASEAEAALTALFDFAAKGLFVDIGDNTSSSGATFRMRVNGAYVGPALHAIAAFPDRLYFNTDSVVNVNAGDTVCLESYHAGVSNALRVRSFGFVGIERSASAATNLAIDNATHAHATDNVGLTTASALAVADTLHSHIVEPLSLVTGSSLSASDTLHGHEADNVTLGTTSAATLSPADAQHAHVSNNLDLTTATDLAPADAVHGHGTDNLTLGTTGSATLAPADAEHAHSADAPVLTTDAHLDVADSLHGHVADNVTLAVSGATTLAPNDAMHGHLADHVDLTTLVDLIIADASHTHLVDGLVLSTQTLLVILNAAHAHLSDNVSLSEAPYLLIAEALHAHTADGMALTVDAWLAVADALHAHGIENLILTSSDGVILGCITISLVTNNVIAHSITQMLVPQSVNNIVADSVC